MRKKDFWLLLPGALVAILLFRAETPLHAVIFSVGYIGLLCLWDACRKAEKERGKR